MNRSPRLAVALVTVAIAAVALSACTGPTSNPSGSATPHTPTTFVAASTVNTLDPLLANTIQNDLAGDLLYDSIVDFDEDGNLVPRVATEWEVASDSKSISLTLRDDISFTDGTPLTAGDVVYSLDRIKAAATGVASLLPQYASSEAVDDTHVTISLTAPNSAFIGALAKVYVVNSAVVAQHEGSDHAQSWLASNAAGSGAYTVTAFTQGQVIKMALNPDSWNKADGRPDTFVIQFFPETASAVTGLRAGSVNLASLGTKDVETFAKDQNFTPVEVPSGGTSYIYFNTQKGVTADPRVREAIQLAYDYKAHVKTILGGHGTLATQISPPGLGCPADLPAPKEDLDEAKSLVDEAGAAGSTLTMLYQPNLSDQTQAATLLQSNLKEIGITLNLQTTTFPAYLQLLSDVGTTPDLAIANEYPRYPDPDALMNNMLNSRFVGKGANKSQYSNPAVDTLLAQAQAETDKGARCDLYTQVEKLVAADHAIMPIANATFQFVTTSNVSGVTGSPVRILFDPLAIRMQ